MVWSYVPRAAQINRTIIMLQKKDQSEQICYVVAKITCNTSHTISQLSTTH